MNKIIVSVEDNNVSINYEPELTAETAKDFYMASVNGAYVTLIEVLSNLLPVLRPATQLERDNNVYIFREGDAGVLENNLYKQRQSVYDSLVSVFNTILRTVFPDVEYIEHCKQFQQNLSFEGKEEDVNAFNEKAKEVAEYVRTNFNDLIKEVLDEGAEIAEKEKEKKADEE